MKCEEIARAGTKKAAIERIRQMQKYSSVNGVDPNAIIMVQRGRMPTWFCHLVRGTILEFLGYEKYPT